MIHIWKLSELDLELDVKELLKYPLLADIYRKDTSKERYVSKQYFRYLDFMTATNGYCRLNGLTFDEAHIYSIKQCALPKDFIFPGNNKIVIEYIKDSIEYDVVTESILSCIKSLKISSKSLTSYMDYLNETIEKQFKDKDGALIDLTIIVNKVIKTIGDIPKTISVYEELLAKQKSNKQTLRGNNEFRQSMDGDTDIERYADGTTDDDD